MTRYRPVVRRVAAHRKPVWETPCPFCKAPPYHYCASRKRRRAFTYHYARLFAARTNGYIL